MVSLHGRAILVFYADWPKHTDSSGEETGELPMFTTRFRTMTTFRGAASQTRHNSFVASGIRMQLTIHTPKQEDRRKLLPQPRCLQHQPNRQPPFRQKSPSPLPAGNSLF